jgi:hypothetical protein
MLACMPQLWSDFSVVDAAPDPATHERLDDVTWPLFVGWIAGPDWVVATPDRVRREPVVHSGAEAEDGTVVYRKVPFSAEDQDEIDDDLDRELRMVGLPPRPRGYDWYLRLDAEQRRVFGNRYGGQVEEGLSDAVSERDYLNHIYQRMSELIPEALRHATRADKPAR